MPMGFFGLESELGKWTLKMLEFYMQVTVPQLYIAIFSIGNVLINRVLKVWSGPSHTVLSHCSELRRPRHSFAYQTSSRVCIYAPSAFSYRAPCPFHRIIRVEGALYSFFVYFSAFCTQIFLKFIRLGYAFPSDVSGMDAIYGLDKSAGSIMFKIDENIYE